MLCAVEVGKYKYEIICKLGHFICYWFLIKQCMFKFDQVCE